MSQEQRLIELETKVAYHEDIVAALNDTIVAQQRRLDAIDARFESLLERVAALTPAEAPADGAEEIPPHY